MYYAPLKVSLPYQHISEIHIADIDLLHGYLLKPLGLFFQWRALTPGQSTSLSLLFQNPDVDNHYGLQ